MPRLTRPNLRGSDGKPFTITINQFKGGTVTLTDESRIPNTAVTTATNMMLDQDGIWRVRYGSQVYGKTLTGPIDGLGTAIKYNSDGTTTSTLLVIDNGALKTSVDGGNWTTVSGNTWTTGKTAKLTQINSRVYITNGYDKLSYYDVATGTIVTYSALGTAAAPTAVAYGGSLSSTATYKLYYRLTYVKNGFESAASSEYTVNVNKQRSAWLNNSTTQDYITLTIPTNTADRVNIYYSDQTGKEVYLDSTTSTSWTDNNFAQPNLFSSYPITDSTAGPVLSNIALSGNRMWGTGDPSNPYRVYFTSQYNPGSFDPFAGAGYIDLNPGSSEKPITVKHFRTGQGTSIATVFTSDPVGGGSIWFVSLSTIQVGQYGITVPSSTSQGSIGTNSPFGVVQSVNNIFYPSIKGFQTLGSAPNILNVLATSEISSSIRPNVQNITMTAAKNIAGIFYYGRIFWSVPYGSTTNNQIWVLDLERNAWCVAWDTAVKQFVEYADSSGTPHLLGIPMSGNQLIEFNQNFLGDLGASFNTDLESGLIYWDEDHSLWARIDKVYVQLARPKGTVNFIVSGTQKNKNIQQLKNIQITSSVVGNSGLGSDLMGSVAMGDSANTPSSYSQSSVTKRLLIKKRLSNLKWAITSSDINAQYNVLEIVIKGKLIPTSDPTGYK
jgi:hypothetical protein